MTLVVEDGTGLANADTYCALADVDAYHAALGNTAWTGADAVKEVAIRKAVAYIDVRFASRFVGKRGTRTQALAWPRTSARDRSGFEIESDAIPSELTKAVAEYALRALSAELLSDPENTAGAIVSESSTVGPISESKTYASGSTRQLPAYPFADKQLSNIIRSAAGPVRA